MSNQDEPKTFLSRKVAEGEKDPEQITNLESKEQREYYRWLTVFGMMKDPKDPTKSAFPFLNEHRDYEQRQNMSKDKMRAEQLTQMIIGMEQQENIRQGIQPMPVKKPGQRDADVGHL